MARYPRILQKIFGGSASDIGNFGSAAAGSPVSGPAPTLTAVQSLSQYLDGWLSAVLGASKFPAIEDMNAIDYLFSSQIAYLLQQGIAEYDATTTYYSKNIVCKVGTYEIYGSIVDTNLGNALSDGTKWVFLGDLSTIANATRFYSGGVSTGSANAQVVATLVPSGFSLSNDGSTACVTAGFTNSGATTFNLNGTGATAVKKWNGTTYVALTGGEITANEAIFLTWNATAAALILNDAPVLGTIASLNTEGVNFTSSGGNLAFGSAPTLPSATVATTQSASDNSTKVATTAFVQTNNIPAALAVGTYIHASHASGTVAAGATVAAATLAPVTLALIGASTGVDASGDTLAGTWECMISYTVASSGRIGLWRRVA